MGEDVQFAAACVESMKSQRTLGPGMNVAVASCMPQLSRVPEGESPRESQIRALLFDPSDVPGLQLPVVSCIACGL